MKIYEIKNSLRGKEEEKKEILEKFIFPRYFMLPVIWNKKRNTLQDMLDTWMASASKFRWISVGWGQQTCE